MKTSDTFIDVHLHLQDAQFDKDRTEIIRSAEQNGIEYMFCNGGKEPSWEKIIDLSHDFDSIMPFIGIHPWFTDQLEASWDVRLRQIVEKNKCGIGEIGLDRLLTKIDINFQLEIFIKQLIIAKDLDRPVTIHCLSAYGHLLKVLKEHLPLPKGSFIHSYSGSADMIPLFSELGLMFSYNGKAMDQSSGRYRKAIEATALDKLLIETDSPFMMPASMLATNQATRNTPLNLPIFAKQIASIKQISLEDLKTATYRNSWKIITAIQVIKTP